MVIEIDALLQVITQVVIEATKAEKMPVLKNPLGRQAVIQAEQKAFNMTEDMFETLSNKVKHQCNETVKSLQYCKLNRYNSENAEEWMKRLRIAAKRMQLLRT